MWYRDGTLSLIKGSNIVTGEGTRWAQVENGVLPGMILLDADGLPHEIKSVETDTSLTLVESYSGVTAVNFSCRIITTYQGDISQFAARFAAQLERMNVDSGVIRTWLTSDATAQLTAEDGSEITLKSLRQILAEHGDAMAWFTANQDSILNAASNASAAAASASAALASQNAAKVSQTSASGSASAASTSKTAAATSATKAATSETNAKSSETNAKSSETAASGSATAAATSETNAKASETAAGTSETNAATSKMNAATSATAAASSKTSAATSATNAGTSATNAKTSETNAKTSETNAKASETTAAASQLAASTSETNAATSEANAATSASAAKVSETNAATSKSAAATSATNAKTSETNAAASRDAAASSANDARTSATNAATSATSASNSASGATTSATNAKTSETNAATSATAAKTSETNAEASKTAAATSATGAASSATAAKTSETNAATSKSAAAISATAANSSAVNARTSETNAKTSETNAATSASNALTSETASKTAQGKAETAAVTATSKATDAANSETNATAAAERAEALAAEMLNGNEPHSDILTSISSLGASSAANQLMYLSGTNKLALTPLAVFMRGLLSSANADAVLRTIGAAKGVSATISPTTGTTGGWVKIAEITIPQNGQTVRLDIGGASGFNVGQPPQAGASTVIIRSGNSNPLGVNAVVYNMTTNGANGIATLNTSGNNYDLYLQFPGYSSNLVVTAQSSSGASVNSIGVLAAAATDLPSGAVEGTVRAVLVGNGDGSVVMPGAISSSKGAAFGDTVEGYYPGGKGFGQQYGTKAAFYNEVTTVGTSEYHPLIKQKITNGDNSWAGSFGWLINSMEWTLQLIDKTGANKNFAWRTSGDFYAPARLLPGDYSNFDARFLNLTDNAVSATKLQTARKIAGVAFDGTADIGISAAAVNALPNTGGIVSGQVTVNQNAEALILKRKNAAQALYIRGRGEDDTVRWYMGNGGADDSVTLHNYIQNTTLQLNATEVYTNRNLRAAGAVTVNGAGESNVILGSGSADVYLQNTKSGKYLQLKDTGVLSYSDNAIYHQGNKPTYADVGAYPLSGGQLNGPVISTDSNGFRIRYGTIGSFFRSDGGSSYFLLTNANDQNGTWNALRPIYWSNTTGNVTMGHSVGVGGTLTANGGLISGNDIRVPTTSGSWIGIRDGIALQSSSAVTTSSAAAIVRQEHADRHFVLAGLGNSQFGIYMVNKSRTVNGTDGAAYLSSDGTWYCNGNGNFNDVYIRSDRRNKRNITKIDGALDKLEKLDGVLYELQGVNGYNQSAGLIAQQVQEVQPELVASDIDPASEEERLRLNYNGVIGMLVEAVKELRAEVKELKEAIA